MWRLRLANRRIGKRLVAILLAVLLLQGAIPFAARADGISIPTFYSATKASYDAWKVDTPAPARTATFVTGTTVVAFYFEYQGATPKSSTFQLTIFDHSGKSIVTGSLHKFDFGAGSEMLSEDNGDPYPPGAYHVQLAVNDIVAAHTDFTIGSAPISVTKAYLITSAAYDGWDPNSSQDPPATSTFTAGTTSVGIFFTFTHARAKIDTFQLVLKDPSGKQIGTGAVHKFSFATGSEALLLPISGNPPAPGPGFGANLLIDGASAVHLSWSIGGTGPAPTPAPTAGPITVQQVRHCNSPDLPAVVRCDEPSVLRVAVTLSDGSAQGTGFVVRVDNTGTYLLTNRHVVEGGRASSMLVYLPDDTQPPLHVLAVLSNDGKPGTAGDLAVIKLAPSKLRPLAFGNSDKLAVGQTVASIGYGLAFELSGPPSVTEGIVSAVHRDLGDNYGPVWIQHQSTINHGNSGGPLLDLHGDVVGVNTLSIDQLPGQSSGGPEPVQGIFFAIPSSMAQVVATKLIAQIEQSGPVKAVQPPPPSNSLFLGKHFAVNLPPSWSRSKLNSGDPLFISADQLVQISVSALAANGHHGTRGDLIRLARDTATGFGTIKKSTVKDATLGTLRGIVLGADFKNRASHLDVYMVQGTGNAYYFLVARVTEPGATATDSAQSASLIHTLRQAR
jgi:S1-C subfamily serine protease